jgi:flagellar biosynthesis/type III secretory pathway protein FliH
LTKELLQFVAKAFAAHNRRLDAAMVNKALKPVLQEKEQVMIKTIFEEKYDEGFFFFISEGKAEGKTEGRAEGQAETLLTFLRTKFCKVPKRIENTVRSMTDPMALDSLAVHVVHCKSLKEFEKALN